jgi:aminomethyltransferase
MKKTSLYERHVELGARIVDFAGWQMPVQYSGLIDEHLTVRNNVGIFDVSHMGTFTIQGSGAFDFLQKMVPNDLGRISKGKAIYTQFCKPDGGVIDDLLIYYVDDNNFYMVVNASNVEKDFNWLTGNLNSDNVKLANIAGQTAVLALQGPFAEKTLTKICKEDLTKLTTFSLLQTEIAGADIIVSRTGYTGEDGFELIFNNRDAVLIWDKLLEAGKEYAIKPIGLGARDTLRLEANLPLYGHELDEFTSPLEARLAWSVKLDKGEFIGRDALLKQKENGPEKRLAGIKTFSRAAVPREGYEIYHEEKLLGKVTSGTFSPTLSYPIALAYVNTKREYKTGDKLEILIRGKYHDAEIVTLPFYKRNRSN